MIELALVGTADGREYGRVKTDNVGNIDFSGPEAQTVQEIVRSRMNVWGLSPHGVLMKLVRDGWANGPLAFKTVHKE